jgi:hypothetical protein
VSVSLLTIYCSLPAFSDTTRHKSNHYFHPSINHHQWTRHPHYLLFQYHRYDATLLESEKERDAIDRRRAFRHNELRKDHCCGLGEAEEWSRSILLDRNEVVRQKRINGSGSGSGSSGDGEVMSVFGNGNGNGNGAVTPSPSGGGQVLNVAILLLDQLAVMYDIERSQQPGYTNNPEDSRRDQPGKVYPAYLPSHLATLRELIVKILLLEVDAQKFHREHSHNYLTKFAIRVDAELPYSSLDLCDAEKGVAVETPSCTWLTSFLKAETEKLTHALYVFCSTFLLLFLFGYFVSLLSIYCSAIAFSCMT